MKGLGINHACSVFARGPGLMRLLALSLLVVLTVMNAGQGLQGGGPQGGGTQGGGTHVGSGPSAVPAARQASNIAVLTIKGEIDETTARSVARRLGLAERAGANAVVIELDTPGGDLNAVLAICDAIKGSTIKNTVAWVNRMAYSGGAVIAIACREIVVNEPSTLGDALPIGVQQNPLFRQINAIPEELRQKFLSPLIAELVSSARQNGYDEMLVQGIASRGVELWLVQNAQTGKQLCITRAEYRLLFGEEPAGGAPVLASAPAGEESSSAGEKSAAQGPTLKEPKHRKTQTPGPGKATEVEPTPVDPNSPSRFIPAAPNMAVNPAKMDISLPTSRPVFTSADHGNWTLVEYVSNGAGPFVLKSSEMLHYKLAVKVVRDDKELMEHFGAKNMLRLDQSWSEGLVSILTWMPVRGLLIAIFLIALFVEMTHPGLVAPGGIAAAALVALIAPPLLINMANWWEIAAILGGIVLVALEIFVIPGFGVAGVVGLLLLFGGLIGTFVPQGSFFPDSAQSRHDMLYGVATMVMAVVTSGVAMYFISKNFKSLPIFSKLVLKDPAKADDSADDMLAAMAPVTGALKKGMTGTALTPLRPAGRVELPGGRIVDAVADIGFIPPGAAVRITSVSEFRVGVERA